MRSIIVDNIEVTEASITEDRSGGDIWEIRGNVPSIGSQYPTGPLRMPAKNLLVKKGQVVRVKLLRGKPKRGKEGSEHEWDQWWEIAPNGWGTTEEEPGPAEQSSAARGNGSTPRGNGAAPSPRPSGERDTQIAWNSAVNNAVHLHGPGEPDWPVIRTHAQVLYGIITNGLDRGMDDPIFTEDAPDGHQKPVQPSPTPKPRERPERPQHPPQSSPEKMHQMDQARHNADGEEVYSATDVVIHIASNYQERGPQDLNSQEVDEVIEAMIEGRVRHYESAGII